MKDRIKLKIQKLLALAEDGSNSAESESALRKAVLLMRKHELNSGEISKEDFIKPTVSPSRNRKSFHQFEKRLYWDISKAVGVLALIMKAVKKGWYKRDEAFRLIGHKDDVELVQYIFDVVAPQIEAAGKDWFKVSEHRTIAEKNNYMRGLANGFTHRLKNQMKSVETSDDEIGTGLVPVDTKCEEAEIWFKENGGSISSVRLATNGQGGYQGGYKDSNNIRYNQGVTGSQAQKRLR